MTMTSTELGELIGRLLVIALAIYAGYKYFNEPKYELPEDRERNERKKREKEQKLKEREKNV